MDLKNAFYKLSSFPKFPLEHIFLKVKYYQMSVEMFHFDILVHIAHHAILTLLFELNSTLKKSDSAQLNLAMWKTLLWQTFARWHERILKHDFFIILMDRIYKAISINLRATFRFFYPEWTKTRDLTFIRTIFAKFGPFSVKLKLDTFRPYATSHTTNCTLLGIYCYKK